MATDNLGITEVSASQSQKEVTINEADNALDNAANGSLDVDVSGGDLTLTPLQFNRAYFLVFTGTPTVDLEVTLPDNKRSFAAVNLTAQEVSIKTPTGTAIVVPSSMGSSFYSDGVGIMGLGAGAAAPPPFVVPSFLPGTTGAPSILLNRIIVPRSITIAINATTISANAAVAATNVAALSVRKNGTPFGTIEFPAGSDIGTFSSSTEETFVQGDVIEIQAPGVVDPTLADISVTIGSTS